MTALAAVYLTLRIVIVAALAAALLVWGTHWAVRSRRLTPFGAWPRFVRRISDPVLKPIERRLLRAGGNPQDAPAWLLGLVVAGGLLALWLVGWIAGLVATLMLLARSGPGAWILAAIRVLVFLLQVALLARIIGSWFGWDRHRSGMRIAYALTDWLVNPIRRLLPAFGPFDFSPMIAWLAVSWILEPLLLSLVRHLLPAA